MTIVISVCLCIIVVLTAFVAYFASLIADYKRIIKVVEDSEAQTRRDNAEAMTSATWYKLECERLKEKLEKLSNDSTNMHKEI